MRFGNWCRENYIALIFAFFVGLITVAPHLIFIQQLGSEYKGLYPMKADAEYYYLSRIHAVYQGDFSVNPYIFEQKHTLPKATLMFGDALLTLPGVILKISVPVLSLIYKFLLPFIATLVLYFLGLQIYSNKFWSVVTAVAVMCGYYFLYPTDLVSIVKFKEVFSSFSDYSRPIYPQLSSILFFLYLYVFYKALDTKTWKFFIWLGVLFGISFYIYFYAFTFIFALNLVSIVVFLLLKKNDLAIKFVWVKILGTVIGSYFIWNLYKVMQSALYPAFAKAEFMELTHKPVISTIWILTSLIFGGYLWFKKKKLEESLNTTDYFFITLLITAFGVVNQQVITGRLLQEGHYHWFFNIPIFILTLSYVGWNFVQNLNKKYVVLIGIFVLILSFYATGFVQWSSYKFNFSQGREDQRYVSVFDYLNTVSKKDDVVFANTEISPLVPIYTFDNVVWDDGALGYLVPEGRRDFTPENILKGDFYTNIKKYKVDYVLWDYQKNPEWKMDQKWNLKFLKEVRGVKVYSLK